MKRPNLFIIGIEEGEEVQLKIRENIFNKIIEKNFPNLKKDMQLKIKEAYRNRQDQKQNSPCHILIKMLNIQNKDKILRAAKGKGQVTYKGRPIRITPNLNLESQKVLDRLLQTLTNHRCKPRILYPVKFSITIDK